MIRPRQFNPVRTIVTLNPLSVFGTGVGTECNLDGLVYLHVVGFDFYGEGCRFTVVLTLNGLIFP